MAEAALTFYGVGADHDEFAGRPGDYALMLRTARAAAECGLDRSETLFLRKGGAPAVAALLRELADLPAPVGRWVVPWDYRGRGMGLERERATAADLAALPSELARHVNREAYRTEQEWTALIRSGQTPVKRFRLYFVSVWPENLERLRSADCGEIIAGLRSAEDALVRQLPSLPDLACSCGDPAGERVYALRDMEWKWQGRYVADHPELGVTARYDDLGAGVRYK